MTRPPVGRLLVDGPAPGAWNMAVDEALLEEAACGRPTLRFYQWSEPTLSLGYFQAVAERARHPPSRSAAVVRRQTGGGALLHDLELTYSLCLSATSHWAREHQRLYEVVHQAFRTALAEWSINTQLHRAVAGDATNATSSHFLCFLRRHPVDLVASANASPFGVKMLGSAQRRRRGAVLQHGGLLLKQTTAAPELPGLADVFGVELLPDELTRRLGPLLSEQLNIAFQAEALSAPERQRAEQLRREKYGSSGWTQRR